MTDAELNAPATREELRALMEQWANDGNPGMVFNRVARTVLSLLADQEGRGEVVEACPHCFMHEPEWLPDAGCWRCGNCCVHLDTVERWQLVGTTPRGSCSCWIGRGGYGGPSEQRIACAVHGDARNPPPVAGPS